tara:strand:+ start:296 stop:436 length:141 start_codon:yes stop_codon:yes gene_type:complete
MIILSVPRIKHAIKKNTKQELAKSLSLIKIKLIEPKAMGLAKLKRS